MQISRTEGAPAGELLGSRPAAGRRRPRLLFLAYYFPPVSTIGAVRALNIAKWLNRVGWDVSVVTPRSSTWVRTDSVEKTDSFLRQEGIRCIRTAYPWSSLASTSLVAADGPMPVRLRGVVRRLARLVSIPDETGWLFEVERACAGLSEEDVDVVFATGPPFGTFRIASKLARRLGCPFVLDYRDLWTGNPHASRPAASRASRLEGVLLERASAVTVVSRSLGQSLAEQFEIHDKVRVISNGFDAEDLALVEPASFGHFAIVYAGTFYPPKRVITPLIDVLKRLSAKGKVPRDGWRFHYYGPQPEHVREAAAGSGLDGNIEIHGLVPRREVLSALRGAGVSVVVTSVAEQGSLQDNSIVTGKVFEALGAGTTTLAIAPPGSDLEGIFDATGLGVRFTSSQIDPMADFLEVAMLGDGPRPSRREVYEWSHLVKGLDAVLREVAFPRG